MSQAMSQTVNFGGNLSAMLSHSATLPPLVPARQQCHTSGASVCVGYFAGGAGIVASPVTAADAAISFTVDGAYTASRVSSACSNARRFWSS